MENAVDALKIAFAVMVFTIALTLAISTFSQARETSEAVLYMNDKTNYYSWEDEVNYEESERIVGIETIIPTLYRYYKENYTVIFMQEDGVTGLPIYYVDSTTEKWVRGFSGKPINYFDLNSEIKANCPWVGTVNDIKTNIDLFLKGTSGYNFGNASREVEYSGFLTATPNYANRQFKEQLGEYSTDRTYGMTKINGEDYLEVQDSNGKVGRFEQLESGKWKFDSSKSDSGVVDKDGHAFNIGQAYSLSEITTRIGSSSSTFMDEVETDGEIIELAKPTIKRVIKYTLMP